MSLSLRTWPVRCAPTPSFMDQLLSEDVEQIAILAGI
jgi:hypothetical protein